MLLLSNLLAHFTPQTSKPKWQKGPSCSHIHQKQLHAFVGAKKFSLICLQGTIWQKKQFPLHIGTTNDKCFAICIHDTTGQQEGAL